MIGNCKENLLSQIILLKIHNFAVPIAEILSGNDFWTIAFNWEARKAFIAFQGASKVIVGYGATFKAG